MQFLIIITLVSETEHTEFSKGCFTYQLLFISTCEFSFEKSIGPVEVCGALPFSVL